jgi:hypothetical protein
MRAKLKEVNRVYGSEDDKMNDARNEAIKRLLCYKDAIIASGEDVFIPSKKAGTVLTETEYNGLNTKDKVSVLFQGLESWSDSFYPDKPQSIAHNYLTTVSGKGLPHKAPSHKAPSHKALSHKAPSHKAPSHETPSHKTPPHKTPIYGSPFSGQVFSHYK